MADFLYALDKLTKEETSEPHGMFVRLFTFSTEGREMPIRRDLSADPLPLGSP